MDWDGARVWTFLRCVRDYRAACRANAAPPAHEDGAPFPVRIRSQSDLAAEEEWRMLAWEDPDGDAASPFWADAPMLEGVGSETATPLLPLLAEAGTRLEGLRLGDGSLILKAERHGEAVQVRIVDDGPLMAGGGIRVFHDWGLGLPVDIARLIDLWSVSGGAVPPERVGGRGRDALETESLRRCWRRRRRARPTARSRSRSGAPRGSPGSGKAAAG